MVGLIDIAPSVETVDVQGTPVTVHGISAKGVAHLLGRFPELRKKASAGLPADRTRLARLRM